MDSIDFWEVLSDLKPETVSTINKIIIFGENGSEVIFSTRDEKVYGFGNNSFGELGLEHKNAVKEPQIIRELNDKQIIDFSYGLRHVLAKTITGKLYSWGDNSYGQLGIGSDSSDYRPILVDSLSDKCVIDISCGEYHTLVLTDDNQLYGFGNNDYGQVGCVIPQQYNQYNQYLGENTGLQSKPIKLELNNETVVSISCGSNHSLALTKRGTVYSWGRNDCGQLGTGNHGQIQIPTKITIKNILLIKQIVCGYNHSLLLSECGDIYAFGYNENGTVGFEFDNMHQARNGYRSAIKISELRNVKEIASHFQMNISMAKLKDNTYYVWGKCLNGNNYKPLKTRFKSFNDIIGRLTDYKMTVKPIQLIKPVENQFKCYLSSNRILYNNSDVFNNKDLSDIVFKIGDKEIFVNKFILRVNSEYFKNKYSIKPNKRRYSSTESVDEIENTEIVNNYSYEVFYSYLKYIYTSIVVIENQYLDQLLILSYDHKEEDLITKCSERFFSLDNISITFEKIVELMKYSIDKSLIELENKCIEFIKSLENKDLILKTDSYKNFPNDMKIKILEKLFN